MKLLIENWQKFVNEVDNNESFSQEDIFKEYKTKIEKDLYKKIKDRVNPNNVSLTLYKTDLSSNYLFEVKKEDQSKVREEISNFLKEIKDEDKKKKNFEAEIYKNILELKISGTEPNKNKFTGQNYMQKTDANKIIKVRAFVDGDSLDFNTNNIKPERIKLN